MAILIVEDEDLFREVSCEVMSEIAPCREASSAEEALRMTAAQVFANVIADINLPGIQLPDPPTAAPGSTRLS